MTSLKVYKKLVLGLLDYRAKGMTSDVAHQALVQAFCSSSGRANRVLNSLITGIRKPYNIDKDSALLPSDEIPGALLKLKKHGYFIFPRKLSPETCDRLIEHAKTTNCAIYPPEPHQEGLYSSRQKNTEVMRVPEKSLLQNPEARDFVSDPGLIRLAQRYLGPCPRIDHIGMWWSIARSGLPSREGAQEYHFDLDRIRFLQFFVYLTDCGTKDGPHCFVRGSHQPSAATTTLLSRGYVRISDGDIEKSYPPEDIIEILGLKGTVFAVDTTAFHKGKKPEHHDRLVLQAVYCSSLFGTNKPKYPIDIKMPDTLSAFAKKNPEFIKRFQVAE